VSKALRSSLVVAVALGLASAAGPAAAGPNLFVGFSDDAFKGDPAAAIAVARDLGATAFRITLTWIPGQSQLAPVDTAAFDRVLAAAVGMRLVVAVYSTSPNWAPLDDVAREQYCAYVRNLLERYPTINDVVIWNEPNLSYFWTPQFTGRHRSGRVADDAPVEYTALLARCWDVLHAFRPDVNVIAQPSSPRGNDRRYARSNVSHSPGNFIRRMGAAYRASGRTHPLFDTLGHHVYGHSAERPWKVHKGSTQISQGDWKTLMQALDEAFRGTAQPLPGECPATGRCVQIWYLEAGHQTVPDDAKKSLYSGLETDSHALPDLVDTPPRLDAGDADSLAPDQATQIADGIRLAFCQPYVEAYFNFLLQDEQDLARWQSGPLWADGTPKDSYTAFKRVIGEVNARSIECSQVKGARLAT